MAAQLYPEGPATFPGTAEISPVHLPIRKADRRGSGKVQRSSTSVVVEGSCSGYSGPPGSGRTERASTCRDPRSPWRSAWRRKRLAERSSTSAAGRRRALARRRLRRCLDDRRHPPRPAFGAGGDDPSSVRQGPPGRRCSSIKTWSKAALASGGKPPARPRACPAVDPLCAGTRCRALGSGRGAGRGAVGTDQPLVVRARVAGFRRLPSASRSTGTRYSDLNSTPKAASVNDAVPKSDLASMLFFPW